MRKQLQTIKKLLSRNLAIGVFGLVASFGTTNAQTYLTENFDGTWSGTPAAPSGWTQERIIAVSAAAAVTPVAAGTSGEKDWGQSTWNGSVWSPAPYLASGPSTGAISGTGALSIEDGSFNGSGTARSERRIYSGTFDLTTSTSPYLRFWYYNINGVGITGNIRVIISTDGGATWKTLSNVINGFTTTNNTWNRVNVLIPASMRTANTRIGFSVVNRWGSGDPFIDDLTVEEFTPTTITSAANGDWNVGATWAGGVVPTADNHVVVAHNVVVTNTASTTGIIARCQNLTVNASVTLSFGLGTANLLHVLGNLDIAGTFNSFNGTSGRVTYVNGNVTIQTGGTAVLNTGTTNNGTTAIPTGVTTGASGFVFLNADAASFTNNGTLSAGTNRINTVWHAGSGTFTYNSPVTVPFSFFLIDGLVNPNGNLTLGNAAAAGTAQNIVRVKGAFTAAPTWNNTNILTRNMGYLSTNFTDITPVNINTGEEIQDSVGRMVSGTFVMNTHNNVTLTYPLQVGRGTAYGALTMTNGVLITSPTNLLTCMPNSTGSLGTAPTAGSVAFSSARGSYVVGPVRINFPSTGTGTRNFPLGVGTNFYAVSHNANVRRAVSIATSTAWAGQTITMTIEGAPSGTANSPLTKVMGTRAYRINLNGGPDLPATATINIAGANTTTGNSDGLQGEQQNLFIAQSASLAGPWERRSTTTGTGAFVDNTIYTRTSATAAPGPIAPIATNGEYFAFGTDAVLMTFTSADGERNTNAVAPGATPNTQMLRVKVSTTGVVPITLTQLNLNTDSTGATALANITNAKVWYTGTSPIFSAVNQFGSTVTAPSGAYSVIGSRTLLTGDNYFWVTYDLAPGTALNDSFAAQAVSAVIDGISQPVSQATAGWRIASTPMTYVSSTGTQPLITKVSQGSTNNVVMGLQIVTSPTGSPINLTALDIATTGTTALTDITNLRVWYTGASSTFATTTQFGTTVATPAAAQTVTGSIGLTNGTNYLWVTYDIAGAAVINNLVDAEISGMVVDGSPATPSVTAPVGTRQIKAAYCATAPAASALITNVTLSSMSYNPTLNAGPTYYRNIAPGVSTVSVTRGTTTNLGVTTNDNAVLNAWFDYNDDGDFTDPGEFVAITLATGGAGIAGTTNFTIPCTAVLGEIRMRVITRLSGNPNTDPCRIGGTGEAMDFTITILDNPTAFNFATAQQQTGVVAPNTLDRQILRVPIRVNGCDLARIDELRFTNTSTSATDIVNAKLYRTTGNTFNTTNLRGTIASPVGQFTFTLTDTVTLNDTMNYWLAYDIAPLATISNIADATFDSLQLNIGLGTLTYHVPVVSNPSGSVSIDAPMTYTSSTVTQANTAVVFRGNNNQEVIGFTVNMSAIGSPVNLTAIDLNLGGLTDTADIQNIRVWYTGSSNTFATTTQFGTTQAFAPAVAAPYAFTVIGSQSMLNGANYFWVTYDVRATATPLNVIDGEITQVTIAGNNHVPTVTAPTGNRVIRVPYCATGATNAGDTDIGQIQLFDPTNAVIFNNGSATPTYNNPLANGTYTNFTGLTPANLTRGLSYTIRMDQITAAVNFYAAGLIVYIDYNDDGDFVDAGETVYTSGGTQTGPFATAPAVPTVTFLQGSFTIPCTAALGNLRMRVIVQEGNSATPSCGTFAWGEAEDYTINVLDNPLAFNFTTAQQQTGVVAPGTTDRVITRIPVRVNGCGTAVLSEVRMSTTGTTNNADIVNAKLYRTTGSTFNTSNLRATVAAPIGQFTFGITDTITNNDTTNYWLAYDVAGGAALSNTLDATLDSIQVLGVYQIPSVSNPAGNVLIDAPMTYVGSTTTQSLTSKVVKGAVNNQVIGIEVTTSLIGSPANLTSFDLNLAGTTDTADIQNIRVWYTGSSNTFATTTQFGTTQAFAPAVASPFGFTVSGSQSLNNATNYFWVTFDIKTGSTTGNQVDAECTSLTFAGTPQVPTVTNPIGSRQIKPEYCAVTYLNGCGTDFIARVQLGTINNVTGCTGPLTYYSAIPAPQLPQGSLQTITLEYGSDLNQFARVWVDWNDDGDYDDAGEDLGIQNPANAGANGVATVSFIVPVTSPVGIYRMRIRGGDDNQPLATQSCGASGSGWGEAEEYNIEVTPAPTPTVYVWNQTSPADFTVAGNWTPSRTSINLNDKLLFNGGGNIVVNNVVSQTISSITVDNSTNISFSTAGASISLADSLNLVSGTVTPNAVELIVGTSPTQTGTIISGPGRVRGNLTRWIGGTPATYGFPIANTNRDRLVVLNYSVVPGTLGTVTVGFTPLNILNNNGLPLTEGAITVNKHTPNGYWDLTPGNGLTGGTYDINLNADSMIGITNVAGLVMLHRVNAGSPWTLQGTHVTTSGTVAAPVLSRTGATLYGIWSMGADSAVNPLPVTLTQFTATPSGKDVQLTWTTASELNNRGFDVERSLDGRTFEKVTFVKGAGNSYKVLNYNFTDKGAFNKSAVWFYRLRQVDFDGKFAYSAIVRVNNAAENVNAVSVSPNPYTNNFNVSMVAAAEGNATIELMDVQGRLVSTRTVNVITGVNEVPVNDAATLRSGVYFVRVSMNGETQVVKLVKE